MGEFVLWKSVDTTFAAHAAGIESIQAINTPARLSSSGRITILSSILDDRITFLIDLDAYLSGADLSTKGTMYAVIIDGSEKTAGFVVRGTLERRTVTGTPIPIPDPIASIEVCEAMHVDGNPVPIVDLEATLKLATGVLPDRPAQGPIRGAAHATGEQRSMIPCRVGPFDLIIDATGGRTAPAGRWLRNPTATGAIDSGREVGSSIVPAVDLHALLVPPHDSVGETDGTLVLVETEIGSIGLTVDSTDEPVQNVRRIQVPSLLATESIHEAAVVDGSIRPIVDVSAILTDDHSLRATPEPVSARSNPGDSGVLPFVIGGQTYAVPANEYREIPAMDGRVGFPTSSRIIQAALVVGDELVPLIDLASYLGSTPFDTGVIVGVSRSGLDVVFNVDSIGEKRVLADDDLLPLPKGVSSDVVFGCYLDGEAVALILDVTAIAVGSYGERGRHALFPAADAPSADSDPALVSMVPPIASGPHTREESELSESSEPSDDNTTEPPADEAATPMDVEEDGEAAPEPEKEAVIPVDIDVSDVDEPLVDEFEPPIDVEDYGDSEPELEDVEENGDSEPEPEDVEEDGDATPEPEEEAVIPVDIDVSDVDEPPVDEAATPVDIDFGTTDELPVDESAAPVDEAVEPADIDLEMSVDPSIDSAAASDGQVAGHSDEEWLHEIDRTEIGTSTPRTTEMELYGQSADDAGNDDPIVVPDHGSDEDDEAQPERKSRAPIFALLLVALLCVFALALIPATRSAIVDLWARVVGDGNDQAEGVADPADRPSDGSTAAGTGTDEPEADPANRPADGAAMRPKTEVAERDGGPTRPAAGEAIRPETEGSGSTGGDTPQPLMTTSDGPGLESVSLTIWFDPDSAEITPDARAAIERFADTVTARDGLVEIVGHAALFGTRESCRILSERRAESVRSLLSRLIELPDLQLVSRGAGADVPIGDNSTSHGMSLNRRVEIEAHTGT